MPDPDFRALCAELIDALHDHTSLYPGHEHELVRRARAALEAQPEPVAPTDEQLDKTLFRALCDYMEQKGPFGGPTDEKQLDRAKARAVLARFGRPAIEPVPVSDPPEPEDCDEEGRCWGWLNADDGWNLYPVGYLPWWAYWLPHWALPVPVVEGADA
jgi:hypothetical protein